MAFLPRRFLKRKSKFKTLFVVVGLLGVISLTFGIYLKYQRSVLSFGQSPPETTTTQKRAALPLNITIEAANINLPIKESNIIDGVWEISETGASFLSTSARPSENGNIVIYGHNKKHLFGGLIGKNLVGSIVEIKLMNGDIYKYQITETKTVSPTDIEEVLPTETEVLTLYTCTGLLDSKRLIIKALPVNLN